MHGRPRVRSTAEQQAAKDAERAAKLKAFTSAMDKIFALRADTDNKNASWEELLKLTGGVLSSNPDIATLWVIRREVLVELADTDQLKKELPLTATCLKANPKSYSAWFHRGWVVTKLHESSQADLATELKLTQEFLGHDERNFHCWDYRRAICKIVGSSTEEQIKFSDQLLTTNFGNFSAWFYRSGLLGKDLGETQLKEETDLVMNALFCDPTDNSPWCYYQWLLSSKEVGLFLKFLYVSRALDACVFLFSQPISASRVESIIQLTVNDVSVTTFSSVLKTGLVSHVWQADLSNFFLGRLEIKVNDSASQRLWECVLEENSNESLLTSCNCASRPEPDKQQVAILKEQLELVQQLQDLTGDMKNSLMAQFRVNSLLQTDSTDVACEFLVKAGASDPLRKRAYEDIRSGLIIEHATHKIWENESSDRLLDMSNRGLTRLTYLHCFGLITLLDVSHNQLKVFPPQTAYLVSLVSLDCQDNLLEDLSGLAGMPSLRTIKVQKNKLDNLEQLRPLLSCKKLVELHLSQNPLSNDINCDVTAFIMNSVHGTSFSQSISIFK